MTKKEVKARKEAYTKALKEGRVVCYNDGCSFRSFPTVAAAEAYVAELTAAGLVAGWLIITPDTQIAGERKMTYLTQTRINSLKQYLDDCRNGVDTVVAWNAHKVRMLGRMLGTSKRRLDTR
jgi:hypothetical protein